MIDNTSTGPDVYTVVFLLMLYVIPTVNAFGRLHHNKYAILLTNLFLGWTIIGWVVALIWSATAVRKDEAYRAKWAPPRESNLKPVRPNPTVPPSAK